MLRNRIPDGRIWMLVLGILMLILTASAAAHLFLVPADTASTEATIEITTGAATNDQPRNYTWSDNFDDEPADVGIPDDWEDPDGIDVFNETTTSRARSSPNSYHVYNTSGWQKSIRPQEQEYSGSTRVVNTSVWVYVVSGVGTERGQLSITNPEQGGSGNAIMVTMRQGDLQYYSGGWNTISTTPNNDEWVKIEVYDIDTSTDTYSVHWEAGPDSGTATGLPFNDALASGPHGTELMASGDVYFDDFSTYVYRPPTTGRYGLLASWQTAYNGTATAGNYDFDGDGNDETEQCANCHMSMVSGFAAKHNPPIHPFRTKSGDTGDWFWDDGNHRGPNTQLASQQAGIMPQGTRVVECGDCHTSETPNYLATQSANTTNDPHSVHRDVTNRVGCIRCHVFNNTTFSSGNVTFTQGNATRTSYGIANPINMTRIWDGRFLSTTDEASYTYDNSTGGLNTTGTGWNVYGSAETSRATQYGCGDCHDQFHLKQGLTGTPVEFTFNDSAGSRKGPYAPVDDTESYGINASGYKTCGTCHVTDAHAVHTNGLINSRASFDQVNDASDDSIITSGVLGAELCDQCHSQNVGTTPHHSDPELGTEGNATDPSKKHNRPPDLQPEGLSVDTDADCGFCHA